MASTALHQAITNVQLNDCLSVVLITAIGYDYILTFPKEVEYIWNKPWTRVSTLFVLARYFGMSSVILCAIWASSFIPDPANTCNIFFLISAWGFWIFMCSADLVMILRLWALYDRSRFIIITLLIFYVMEIIFFFIIFVIYSQNGGFNSEAGTTQVLWYSLCAWGKISTVWDGVLDAAQITLSTLMCLLIVIRFIKELLQVYKVMKQFQLNNYMKRLIREGIVYFLVMLVYALINVLGKTIPCFTSSGWQIIPTGALEQIPPFILVPRFILGLRELHARGPRSRDIDTAFGLGSVSWRVAGMSTIVLTDAEQSNGEEQSNEGEVEEGTQEIHQESRSIA